MDTVDSVEAAKMDAIIEDSPSVLEKNFSFADYMVFALMLISSSSVGVFYACKVSCR